MSVYLNDVDDLADNDLRGKIGTMTMPDITDDGPKIAELGRFMTDFRSEVREALNQVVRKDVYQAERLAAELQVAALRQEVVRIEAVHKAELARIDRDLVTHHTDHKNFGARLTSAWVTAGFALAVGLILAVVK